MQVGHIPRIRDEEAIRSLLAVFPVTAILGPRQSGKTTLLNCMSRFIPDSQRVVTIEETAEPTDALPVDNALPFDNVHDEPKVDVNKNK